MLRYELYIAPHAKEKVTDWLGEQSFVVDIGSLEVEYRPLNQPLYATFCLRSHQVYILYVTADRWDVDTLV